MTIERFVPIMDEGGVNRAINVPPTLEGWRYDYGQEAARWRADGKEMLYVAPDGKMIAVPVNATAGYKPAFEAGVPVALFAATLLSNSTGARPQYQYDVTADGSRFLIAHSGAAQCPRRRRNFRLRGVAFGPVAAPPPTSSGALRSRHACG